MANFALTATVFLFSLIGFLAIAVIVSFDVAGLTIAKSSAIRGRQEMVRWSLLNGAWHAGLLGVYALLISGLLEGLAGYFAFLKILGGWLKEAFAIYAFPEVMAEVAGFLQDHTAVAAGVLGLAIIWWTYSTKIVDTPGDADPDGLPLLARTVYRIAMTVARFATFNKVSEADLQAFFRANAEAALVAVDMLALALLAKNLGLMPSLISISGFAVIVFVVVAAICFGVCSWCHRMGYTNRNRVTVSSHNGKTWIDAAGIDTNWCMISLRLLEPWLIFYFSLELISYLLFGKQVHSIGFLFGASLMLYPLVRRHGLGAIVAATVATRMAYEGKEDQPAGSIANTTIRWRDIWQMLRALGLAFAFSMVVFLALCVIWMFYRMVYDDPSLDSLVALVLNLTGLLSLPAIIFSDGWRRRVGILFDWVDDNRQAFQFTILAVFIAALAPVFQEVSVIGAQRSFAALASACKFYGLGVNENHAHAAQVVMFLLWLLLWATLLPRFADRAPVPAGEAGQRPPRWADIAERGDWAHIMKPLAFMMLSLVFVMMGNQQVFAIYDSYEAARPGHCVG
ncbi:hypothetical protein FHS91_002853 [Sphingobium xanthum]|uniref:hypothetical protein n=1 Tax=Sphingobium xanthum TaxID=1387165 RepID=UPI001C8B36D8|nr:hypothetical protein [Sphingobium xanthum]